MVKNVLLLAIVSLFLGGCATWEGIKTDTSDGWHATKNAIHDATE